MPVLDKKSRMISFRMSETEYLYAERCCPAHGVRSVSTFARNATIGVMRNPYLGRPQLTPENEELLLTLQHQVLCLRAELDRLAGLLGKASTPQPAASTLSQ